LYACREHAKLLWSINVDRLALRLGAVGADGLFTLMLSTIVLVATLSLSLIWPFRHVVRTARNAPVAVPPGSMLVVLGKRLVNGEVTSDYAARLDRAGKLYSEDNKHSILIVGGFTGDAVVSEAAAGSEYLVHRGVRAAQILVEDASRHTLENLRNARSLLQSSGYESFAIITSRYHLARSRNIAQGLGMNLNLCGAEDEFRLQAAGLPRLLLEACYIHWYYTGAIWSRLTRSKKSLERIS